MQGRGAGFQPAERPMPTGRLALPGGRPAISPDIPPREWVEGGDYRAEAQGRREAGKGKGIPIPVVSWPERLAEIAGGTEWHQDKGIWENVAPLQGLARFDRFPGLHRLARPPTSTDPLLLLAGLVHFGPSALPRVNFDVCRELDSACRPHPTSATGARASRRPRAAGNRGGAARGEDRRHGGAP